MAVAVAREPKNFPCDSCDCYPDGRSRDGTKWKIPGVLESDICFRKRLTARSLLMLELYAHYKNGILPVAGGLLDQAFAYYHAMSVIDRWMRSNGDA
jgi:hypothetical protein